MSITSNESDSSLSSESSWTVINNSEAILQKENNCEDILNVSKNISEQKQGNGENGFILFDEYCMERLAEQNNRKNKSNSKRKNKRKKKCNDNSLNILSITACLFTIIGISLLTTLLPQNFAESAEIDNIQSHLSNIYEKSLIPTKENTTEALHQTIASLNTIDLLNTLDILQENVSQGTCEALFEDYPNNSFNFEEITSELNNEEHELSFIEHIHNKTYFLVEKAKELVKSPGLRMFIVAILQDICLIKLISELSKKTNIDINLDEESVEKTNKKAKRTVTTNKKRSDKNQKKKKGSKQSILDQTVIKKINSQYNNINKKSLNENGKSECERRFEELDTRWATLGQHHRNKILQIKNKFQQDIFKIKELEKETYNRTQKINFTREKYIQRLKADREIYLHKLRNLREERRKILKTVCPRLDSVKEIDAKDAAVGNYAVIMPSSTDFYTNLENLKNKESGSNSVTLTSLDNETFNYVPSQSIPSEKVNNTSRLSRQKKLNKYCDLKRKYLKKKIAQKKKKEAKKNCLEVQDVLKNIVHSVTSKVSGDTSDKSALNQDNGSPLNDVYEMAFEQQSKRIKNDDQIKWEKKEKPKQYLRSHCLLTKCDPSKTYRAQIIKKGIL